MSQTDRRGHDRQDRQRSDSIGRTVLKRWPKNANKLATELRISKQVCKSELSDSTQYTTDGRRVYLIRQIETHKS